jgi:hypothetical protein
MGASHARLARQWVSRLARRLWHLLSAVLTAQRYYSSIWAFGKYRNRHCCCKPQEVGAASAQFSFPLAESARLMPVTASPLPGYPGAIAGLIS